MKSKSLTRIEEKLQTLDDSSYRYRVLETCRRFKTSWIELGEALFACHRDKLYIEWGFITFEGYCTKELGIKQPTAAKLLKSYHFLETEEPSYIERVRGQVEPEDKHPDLESVNLLRLAKNNKKFDETQYRKIRKQVLDDAREPADVRKELRMLSDSGPQKKPDEVRAERRQKFLKSFVRQLEGFRLEAMANKFLPPRLIDTLDEVVQAAEKELNRD
jgi:hypothetical protein